MFLKAFGDLRFWQTPQQLTLRQLGRVLLVALIPLVWMFRRLLDSGYQFVGNDADLPGNWIFRFKFARLVLQAGLPPWWNPYFLMGYPNLQGPAQPNSLINIFQRLFTSIDKGLDHTLFALAVLLALAMIGFLSCLRFSPLASLVGGLLFAGTGTVTTQLFAGHVDLYASFCLTSLALLTCFWGIRQARIVWLLPAALTVAGVLCAGNTQGAYIVLWLNSAFFLLRALLGSPDPVPAPTLWTVAPQQRRDGFLLASVPGRTRLFEVAWTMVKLALVYLLAAELSTFFWYPSLSAGSDIGLDGIQADIYTHSAPPIAWLSVIVPHFFLGTGQQYSWTGWAGWEGQPGSGPCCLLLLIVGVALRPRRDLLLPGLLLAFGTILALGKYTPGFHLYASLDPLIGRLEVPSRFLLVANFAFTIFAAWGVDSLVQSGWVVSKTLARALFRLALAASVLWLVGYYLDGSQTLWLEFIRHVQFDFAYSGLTPVNAEEYYVVSWMRYSAVCVVVVSFVYFLLRLPQKWRPLAMTLLILLDVTRFNYPYANLRANLDFVPPAALQDVFEQQKFTGKVSNLYEPRWTGAFGTLLYSEFDAQLAPMEPEVDRLVRCARKLFDDATVPGLPLFDHPCLLNRLVGVQAYIHDRSLFDNAQMTQLFKGTDSYHTELENWQVSEDHLQRAPVYLSRSAQHMADAYRMLEALQKEPDKFKNAVNFIPAGTYAYLARRMNEPSFRKNYTMPAGTEEIVAIDRKFPTSVEVSCRLGAPAMIVLNEAWSEDWRVIVDDKDDVCLPCQMGYNRGVLVTAGTHRIEFYFLPKSVLQAQRHSWAVLVVSCLSVIFLWGATAFSSWWMGHEVSR